MNNQTTNNKQKRVKTLAQEQRKKGAPLNWAEYQTFFIFKKEFEKSLAELRTENDEKRYLKLVENLKYYKNELNELRKKAIQNTVITEKEKNIFYVMIKNDRLVYIRRLDDLILKMYDVKNQRSIFEEVQT